MLKYEGTTAETNTKIGVFWNVSKNSIHEAENEFLWKVILRKLEVKELKKIFKKLFLLFLFGQMKRNILISLQNKTEYILRAESTRADIDTSNI